MIRQVSVYSFRVLCDYTKNDGGQISRRMCCNWLSTSSALRELGKINNSSASNSRVIWKRTYVRGIRKDDNAEEEEQQINRTKETSEGEFTGTPVLNDKPDVGKLLENAATFQEQRNQSPEDVWSTPVYPKGAIVGQSQALHSSRPQVDPRKTSIIMFPGQGSQFVGMGKKLLSYPNVSEMYECASDILGYDLKKMCIEGPKSELMKTVHCQPAIMVTSLAAVERLKAENAEIVESCAATAGFSVGEFAALVFAGALRFEDAIRVVKIRAEAMQAASELLPSGMMTVFFSPDARVNYACVVAKEWCRKLGISDPECKIANYLYPHCKVVAGNEEALQFIELNAADFGIRRYKRLPVSGAFHTDLMLPAVKPLREALKNVNIELPLIPVHSNVDGKRYRTVQHIRKNLAEQLSSPVKWEQTLHILYERNDETPYPQTFECGPGKSLRAVLKNVNAKAAESAKCIET